MKFLTFSGYGDYTELPKEFFKIFKKNKFPYNRIGEIIEFLEKQEKVYIGENTTQSFERLKNDPNLILNIIDKKNNRSTYYYYDRKSRYLISMNIIDIDTNIPWKLNDYDGAEGIVYHKETKIINKDINMAEF